MMEFWNKLQCEVAEEAKRSTTSHESRTHSLCVCNTMTDECLNATFVYDHSFGLSPFSDGPDHDNDTDIKHIKNYTNSIRSLLAAVVVVVAFNSLLFLFAQSSIQLAAVATMYSIVSAFCICHVRNGYVNETNAQRPDKTICIRAIWRFIRWRRRSLSWSMRRSFFTRLGLFHFAVDFFVLSFS